MVGTGRAASERYLAQDQRNVGAHSKAAWAPYPSSGTCLSASQLGNRLTVHTIAQSGDSRKAQNFCSKSHWVAHASWRLVGEAETATERAGVSVALVFRKSHHSRLSGRRIAVTTGPSGRHLDSPATETRAEKRIVSVGRSWATLATRRPFCARPLAL